jgi:hypothetical protein
MRPLKAALLGLAAVAACVVSTGRTAQADFQFDSTGGGGGTVISAIDPSPGNALAQNGSTAIANFVSGVGPTTFQLYYQAAVGTLVKPDGTLLLPSGQLTVVASVEETVTSVTGGGASASFAVVPGHAGDFLKIYQNAGVVFDNLAGTGFTAGNLILTAFVVPSAAGSGSFTNAPGAPVLFDQHGADNYAGKLSTTGNGVSTIDFQVAGVLPGYFPGGVPSIIALRFVTSVSTPFIAVDPSRSFVQMGGPVPNLGAINGVSGPDFQFVADAFVTPIPEPSSLCLMGLGLAGVFAVARRKRAAQVA